MIRILQAVQSMPRLVSLDLSENDIDYSVVVLRQYLESPICILEKLSLICADVDDN